jgi:hypothetical protein
MKAEEVCVGGGHHPGLAGASSFITRGGRVERIEWSMSSSAVGSGFAVGDELSMSRSCSPLKNRQPLDDPQHLAPLVPAYLGELLGRPELSSLSRRTNGQVPCRPCSAQRTPCFSFTSGLQDDLLLCELVG